MLAVDTFSLVDATVAQLRHALDGGSLTSVELVTLYLHHIAQFDMRGPSLNSICILNPQALQEAQASDDYRATAGHKARPLEGIPFTVKDSFKVKGMTVAAGSPAFAHLLAPDDAAIVEKLREAGAIVLGRTNMPPMADGGPQRGLYGRSESPYSTIYGTTAYASGSSNGSGTSTTASLAAFGFAGETVSSGRSPASSNALVGYSPSRGVIPNRGQWPLYPTCDVIVPHTRTVPDLFDVLNIIVFDDDKASTGIDFWRNQLYVFISKTSQV
jgi:Asp-tRNA(Asn)/Glu-tRNA(Gln) amidotransferase A subunit family amidase